ncbi:hypothetical protein [Streptomyces sp. ML-6]|uniref:hypothetical protein n=1 Tax=Streptomyces sp. ML-6 TaxID=2982693 RepID=UPI0024BFE527|nr:hypothetical protein [Streptomyces sp. ML-6]MDK0525070.1 hypothetical protein [Streptomyces sp. ML-6]
MPTNSHEIPLGHSIPAHRVHGWCSHCPGRSLAEEVAAWQVDALDRTATTASGGDDRDAKNERLRTENERMHHEPEVMYGGAFDSPSTAGQADLRGRVAELEAAVQRAHRLATRLEEFAENALRVDDRELYATIAKDLRERLNATAAPEATP